MPQSSTIKYHINVPTDTKTISLKTIDSMIKQALSSFNLQKVSAWVATEGAPGWRVSVIFNEPFPQNQNSLTVPVTDECQKLSIPLSGKVTAWEHP